MCDRDGQTHWAAIKRAIVSTPETAVLERAVPPDIAAAYKGKVSGWRQIVLGWAFESLPPSVRHPTLGRIEFTRNGLRHALAHGRGPLKLLLLPHLPAMLPAAPLFHTDERGTETYHNLAHRLRFQEATYIARLVVRENRNGKRFYDHEFSEIKKLEELPIGTEAAPEGTAALTPQVTTSILAQILRINTEHQPP